MILHIFPVYFTSKTHMTDFDVELWRMLIAEICYPLLQRVFVLCSVFCSVCCLLFFSYFLVESLAMF